MKIRLSRFGTKHKPYYHVVVADSRRARDGKFLEQVGLYDPQRPLSEAKLDMPRIEHWKSVGAKATDMVNKIIRETKKVETRASAG